MESFQPKKQQTTGRETLPAEVRERELEYISRRRAAASVAPLESGEEAPLIGIALSGGGIGSATFSLGVLQKFAKSGLLKLTDYMSTVSGGSYAGSCLSSMMSVTKEDFVDPSRTKYAQRKLSFDLGENFPLSQPDEIQHLRRHADFRVSGMGWFRKETLRALGYSAMASGATLAMFTSFLLVIVAAIFSFGIIAGGFDFWRTLIQVDNEFSVRGIFSAFVPDSALIAATAFLTGFFGTAFLSLSYLREKPFEDNSTSGETAREAQERKMFWRFTGSMFGIALLTTAASRAFVHQIFPDATYNLFFCPVFVCLGALLASWTGYSSLRNDKPTWNWTGRNRSIVNGVQGICVLGLLTFLFATVSIALTGMFFHETFEFLLVWAITLFVARLFLPRTGILFKIRPAENQIMQFLQKWIPSIALPILVFLAIVIGSGLLLKIPLMLAWYGAPLVLFSAIGGLVGMLLIDRFVNFNRVSLHYFYRDRMDDTYLFTEATVKHHGLRNIRDDSQIKLSELHDKADPTDLTKEDPNPTPYQLIQCALNLPGSRDLASGDVKADHFLFSKDFCGSATTGYVPSTIFRDGRTKLTFATALSGTPADSETGFETSFPVALLSTLLNIRPGYWIRNPRCYGKDTIYSKAAKPSLVDSNLANERDSVLFWPVFLLRELMGFVDASQPFINLSDGGHTGDNLGLYPLLQRRCKLIIVCDGDQDPDYSFASLASAIRRINVDENVTVDIDLNQFKSSRRHRRPHSHFAVGRIVYPVNELDNDADENKPTEGWLIYLKSSFINRDEPAVVKSFAQKCSTFPHELGAKIHLGDDQFEAHRALGEHIAAALLKNMKEHDFRGELGEDGPANAEPLISWCRETYKAYRV